MKTLTVNQIMLLLDIYRGANIQKQIGTYRKDLITLVNRDLITAPDFEWSVTPIGTKLVLEMQSMTIINPL